MKRYLYFILLPFALSSCLVINSGSISSGPLLSVRDSYVDIARGTCKSVAVFGIGCMHKKNMILQAKADLVQEPPAESRGILL